MNIMKIKIKDWKVWIIRAVYGVNDHNLPKTRCEFIKKFTASIAVFILCFPFLLYMLVGILVKNEDGLYHNPENRVPPIVFFLIMLAGLVTGSVLGDYFFDNLWWTWPLSIVGVILGGFLAILVVAGSIFGVKHLVEKISTKPKPPKPSDYDIPREYNFAYEEYLNKLEAYYERKDNSAWGMLKSRISSKKELFCPTIDYIIDEDKDDTTE
jgi:hypothetical protein